MFDHVGFFFWLAAGAEIVVKHGGDMDRVEIDLASPPTRMSADDLLGLGEALKDSQRVFRGLPSRLAHASNRH